jgi:transposase
MGKSITYVGLDVHKDSIQVAMYLPRKKEPVEWRMKNTAKAMPRLARRLHKEAPGPVHCCYEAGPCGYAPQRALLKADISCQVVAPALIPVKPGERLKTDRRDARKLGRLLRTGDLTEVYPPTEADEAVRDLCRAREDAKEDRDRARHRLQTFLLRRGILYTEGRTAWSRLHKKWLRSLSLEPAAAQATLDDYLQAVEIAEDRVKALDGKLEEVAKQPPYATAVSKLRCFRGIDTLTALILVAELHGFLRFSSPSGLMGYLGLIPSEWSSGGTRRQGGITKTGNAHVRRVLVEAAWHYRHRPAVGRNLAARRVGQPDWAIHIADKAQRRLHQKYWRLVNRGKQPNKATTAIGRELAGFVWAVLYREAQERLVKIAA